MHQGYSVIFFIILYGCVWLGFMQFYGRLNCSFQLLHIGEKDQLQRNHSFFWTCCQNAIEAVQGVPFQKLCTEISKSPDLGPPSFASATEFLQGAGQSQTVIQVKHSMCLFWFVSQSWLLGNIAPVLTQKRWKTFQIYFRFIINIYVLVCHLLLLGWFLGNKNVDTCSTFTKGFQHFNCKLH